jgi:hypothetical protein
VTDSCYDVNIQALGKFNHNALIKLVSVPRQESDWQFICVLRVSIIIIFFFFLDLRPI